MEFQSLVDGLTQHKAYLYSTGLIGVVLFFVARGLGNRFSEDLYDFCKKRLGLGGAGKRLLPAAGRLPEAQSLEKMSMEPKTDGKDANIAPTVEPPAAPAAETPAAQPQTFVIATAKRQYRVNRTLAQGDLATLYEGEYGWAGGARGEVAIKIACDPADNDLLQNETRMLRLLQTEPGAYGKHLPVLLDRFKTDQGQTGIVMERIDGYDLYSVREKYPDGIPQEHIVWIFRRALSALGYAHSKGILHGNIEPGHILVRPRDHNVHLVDWCYALYKPSQTGAGFRCLNEEYSPPEVAERQPPIPASDLYSLAKCMVYLLGGDTRRLTLPARVDARLQRFIQFFLRPSPLQRAQDAWEMYGQLDALREEIFGPHRFIEFEM